VIASKSSWKAAPEPVKAEARSASSRGNDLCRQVMNLGEPPAKTATKIERAPNEKGQQTRDAGRLAAPLEDGHFGPGARIGQTERSDEGGEIESGGEEEKPFVGLWHVLV